MNKEELLKTNMNGQISYWLGEICVSIGAGDIRAAIFRMIDFYQQDAYARGVAAGKEAK